jgi:hypothetical protein
MKKIITLVLGFLLLTVPFANAAVATFDDLTPPTAYEVPGGGAYYNGSDSAGGFLSSDYWFTNNYNTDHGSWDGWAYSNTTDTTTEGSTNQWSSVTGGGVNGSANYGVSYYSTYGKNHTQILSGISTGEYAQAVSGFYITNTTYANLSMTNGDSFAKKFGGESGTDADWFKVTAFGLDSNYERTGDTVDFYLADYRSEDSGDDYIVTDWTWFDLSGLGVVSGLEFELSSSDVGSYGMNTPAYFAMDDFNGAAPVPVPAAVWLFGSGLVGLLGLKRRNQA